MDVCPVALLTQAAISTKPKTAVNANYKLMTINHFALCFLTIGCVSFSGCATDTTTTQTQTDQTAKRVQTQEELRKSDQSEIGPALEKTDPAVRMSGPR
jgi:hypothetical protein